MRRLPGHDPHWAAKCVRRMLCPWPTGIFIRAIAPQTTRTPSMQVPMRRLLASLALVVAIPSMARADNVTTYVFQGCIKNLSCHTAAVTVTEFGELNAGIVIDLFSLFLQAGSAYQITLFPSPSDTDLETGMCERVGPQEDSFSSYAPTGFVPTRVRLSVRHGGAAGECGPGPLVSYVDLTLVNQTSTVPEPATLALVIPGLAAVAGGVRLRRRYRS
jgi:hypothetical protein